MPVAKEKFKATEALDTQCQDLAAEASAAAIEDCRGAQMLRQAYALAIKDAALHRQQAVRQRLISEIGLTEALPVIRSRTLICFAWVWLVIRRWIYRAKAIVQVTRYICIESRVPKSIAAAVDSCSMD